MLASKLKRDDGLKESQASATASDCAWQVSVRVTTRVEKFSLKLKLLMYATWCLPKRKCLPGTWNPNITETGEDMSQNFDDPPTIQAAGHHLWDKEDFRHQVEDYIKCCARLYEERTAGPWAVAEKIAST
ncbi:hypothetical protein M91_01891 [Bos mutus]|uniref:Uncharacterized protein n=1 Tax=Bos mutus TaxID=72004 RepID=L8I436_9CETA|nr:hypothetical protein M91_01891 [Bos mutus]